MLLGCFVHDLQAIVDALKVGSDLSVDEVADELGLWEFEL